VFLLVGSASSGILNDVMIRNFSVGKILQVV